MVQQKIREQQKRYGGDINLDKDTVDDIIPIEFEETKQWKQSCVNLFFKTGHIQPNNSCPIDNTGICLFSFSKSCDHTSLRDHGASGIIYGIFCVRHARMFNNANAGMALMSSGYELVSGAYKQAFHQPYMFLTTFMDVNMSVEDVKNKLNYLDWDSSIERERICRFLSLLSHEYNKLEPNKELSAFKAYLSELEVQYKTSLSRQQGLAGITLPFTVKKSFIEKSDNDVFQHIKPITYEDGKHAVIEWKFTNLNSLDEVNLLSMRLESYMHGVAYCPNVKMQDDRIICGSGFGIHHAYKNYDEGVHELGHNCYDSAIAAKVTKNYVLVRQDVLTMMYIPSGAIIPQPLMPALLARENSNNFDIRRIQTVDQSSVPAIR